MRRYSGNSRKGAPVSRSAVPVLIIFCIFAFLVTVVAWRIVENVLDSVDRSTRYDQIIVSAGKRNGVDPRLLKAVIWRESKFDRRERGSKGEIGLMQVMPKFAVKEWADAHKRKVPSDGALFDPELNIEIGSWYLGRALRHWKKYKECTTLALCEYNAGRSRAEAWKPKDLNGSVVDRIDILSTHSYVKDINRKYAEYVKEWDYKNELKKK